MARGALTGRLLRAAVTLLLAAAIVAATGVAYARGGMRPAPAERPVTVAAAGWVGRWTASPTRVTDARGDSWTPDTAVATGGVRRTMPGARGTGSPRLYAIARVGVTAYHLPVPAAGTYAITLYLGDPAAVFEVRAGGATAGANRLPAAGGDHPDHVLLLVTTTARRLDLTLTPRPDRPVVSAVGVALARTGAAPQTVRLDDTFDGPAAPAPADWQPDLGGNGWGNGELQSYTAANAALDGAGHLAVTATRGAVTGPDGRTRDYASARLTTKGSFLAGYGRVTARIRMPAARAGLLPAFWLLGADAYGPTGWPAAGEIDVVEAGRQAAGQLNAAVFGPGARDRPYQRAGFATLPSALSAGFHTYAVDRYPGIVQFSVDGHPYLTVTAADLPAGGRWVFDGPFFLILNVAVGGTVAGTPPVGTSFPQTMLVDRVTATGW